jgi:hypothetical protein
MNSFVREYAFIVMKFSPPLLLSFAVSVFSTGQTATPSQPLTTATASPTATSGDVGLLLTRIEQETRGLNTDLSKLHIEKWKTDSSAKQQAMENATSIQRNITAALPELIGAVRSAPQSLAANFKLYRNVNALYDVVANLAESTGAFGRREEYAGISPHAAALDDLRRSYADSLLQMATNADNTIVAAQRAQAAAAAQAPPPPKKVIVDEDDSATAARKKKKAKKSTASSSSAGTSTPQ